MFARVAIIILVAAACATAAMAQGLPAPGNVRATAAGQTVRLTWETSVFEPYRVRVEAGTAPGATDASFSRSPDFPYTLVVASVPSGTYYVRLRIDRDGQISGPSNEAVVTVAGCPGVPDPPRLQAEATGQTVALQWTYAYPAGCFPSSLRLEAGGAPGASDVLTLDLPDYNVTRREFRSVPFGTYYVRLRADRFGVIGSPSNEVRLDIGCLPPPSILNPLATVVGNAARFSWEYSAEATADFDVSLEAGSQPGAANIAAIPVPAGAAAGYNVAGAEGVYYTRLRATNACGTTVSPEVPVTLAAECVAPPPIPFADASLGQSTASLMWHPSAGGGLVMTYDVQVGTAAGQADVARRTVDGRYTPFPGYFREMFTVPAERAYFRVTPRNACGSARPTEVYATNAAGCWNAQAPQSLSARVAGTAVVLAWPGSAFPEYLLETFVEIGSSPGTSHIRSPIMSTYPPPSFSVTLPSGRYYARARNRVRNCDAVSNPSPEVTFLIP